MDNEELQHSIAELRSELAKLKRQVGGSGVSASGGGDDFTGEDQDISSLDVGNLLPEVLSGGGQGLGSLLGSLSSGGGMHGQLLEAFARVSPEMGRAASQLRALVPVFSLLQQKNRTGSRTAVRSSATATSGQATASMSRSELQHQRLGQGGQEFTVRSICPWWG